MEHESDVDVNCNWCARNNPQMLSKEIRRLKNQRTTRDHSEYGIIKLSQNTEKSPGHLRKLAVSQTPIKYHQLTLV